MTAVVLRELSGIAELKQSEAVQRAVWGEDDPPDNADLMLALQSEGGLVAGAFRGGRMVGFLLAFPSATPGVQHSHRLAVLPEARGLGLGPRLKWFQRDWCLARGIGRVRWTFDPARRVNARLNVLALGGEAGVYLRDHYGPMAGINAGLPSDRLLLEWELDSPAVQARARGLPPPPITAALRVPIPEAIEAQVAADPGAALAARLALREALEAAFARGLRIRGLEPDGSAYLLG